jgi:hypothetical protein
MIIKRKSPAFKKAYTTIMDAEWKNQKTDLSSATCLERDCAFQEKVCQKQKCYPYDKQHVSLPRLVSAFSALINCEETDEAKEVQYNGDYSIRNELSADTWVQEDN